MTNSRYRPGDWLIYCVTKFGVQPGSRAQNVQPARHGDEYCYTVDKFWVVAAVQPDGSLVLRTRRGKEYQVAADDPHLRRPRFWERWWHRSRFPSIETQPVAANVNS